MTTLTVQVTAQQSLNQLKGRAYGLTSSAICIAIGVVVLTQI